MKNVVLLQWLFNIRPTDTQISRDFKVHNQITCETKVQVVVFPRELVSLFSSNQKTNLCREV